MHIGEKLKKLRKQRNITIKELAQATGLSIGFISNLERNLNSPSVSNLQLICQALNINIVDLFHSENESSALVTRKNEREQIFTEENTHIQYELIAPTLSEMNAICITVKGNSELSNMSWGHNTDEIGLVVKGSIEIHVQNEILLLNEGDTIHIPKGTPHKYRNPSKETSVSYWFSTKK